VIDDEDAGVGGMQLRDYVQHPARRSGSFFKH
jgi:hypothetical protein